MPPATQTAAALPPFQFTAPPYDPAEALPALQAIQHELQWRRKAALTCRQAAHEAAAAGRRAEYWHLLALTERLAGLTFNGPAVPHYERLARMAEQPGGLQAIQHAGRPKAGAAEGTVQFFVVPKAA